jgi:hypothetical protein
MENLHVKSALSSNNLRLQQVIFDFALEQCWMTMYTLRIHKFKSKQRLPVLMLLQLVNHCTDVRAPS